MKRINTKHKIKCLSTPKIDLSKAIDKRFTHISPKFDGINISMFYCEFNRKHIFVTKGNRSFGEDATEKIYGLLTKEKIKELIDFFELNKAMVMIFELVFVKPNASTDYPKGVCIATNFIASKRTCGKFLSHFNNLELKLLYYINQDYNLCIGEIYEKSNAISNTFKNKYPNIEQDGVILYNLESDTDSFYKQSFKLKHHRDISAVKYFIIKEVTLIDIINLVGETGRLTDIGVFEESTLFDTKYTRGVLKGVSNLKIGDKTLFKFRSGSAPSNVLIHEPDFI